MMDQKVKQLWVAALRSGKYQQGVDKLRKDDSYCVLGVLCDQFPGGEWVEDRRECEYGFRVSMTEGIISYCLPDAIVKWAQVDDSLPGIQVNRDIHINLSSLNDGDMPFYQLADCIDWGL
ncbi:hypothetical protein LCGC14_1868600 [marine sediment metagenome]|uniref:Uncharacterized protein n=1 Tax=marine sediment metagenome TaxID=412755 RepID=A0A0F9IJQ0_9ZZZZ